MIWILTKSIGYRGSQGHPLSEQNPLIFLRFQSGAIYDGEWTGAYRDGFGT